MIHMHLKIQYLTLINDTSYQICAYLGIYDAGNVDITPTILTLQSTPPEFFYHNYLEFHIVSDISNTLPVVEAF